MTRDLRVCFVGDSFVAGVGDPLCLGWAGRLAARALSGGQALTSYNLGVRRQTSADILNRWLDECIPRLQGGTDQRVVLSFGVNDTTEENGRTRVALDDSAANLARMVGQATGRGWPVLVVGPPPVEDPGQNDRTAVLDQRFVAVCRDAAVPYVPVHHPLRDSVVWMREIRAGDGAHPGAGGYGEMAGLVEPYWLDWLSGGDVPENDEGGLRCAEGIE